MKSLIDSFIVLRPHKAVKAARGMLENINSDTQSRAKDLTQVSLNFVDVQAVCILLRHLNDFVI